MTADRLRILAACVLVLGTPGCNGDATKDAKSADAAKAGDKSDKSGDDKADKSGDDKGDKSGDDKGDKSGDDKADKSGDDKAAAEAGDDKAADDKAAAEAGDEAAADDGAVAPDGDAAKPSEGPVDWGSVYATFKSDTGRVIDIIDASAPEGAPGTLDNLGESCDGCNGTDKVLDPKDPRFPADHKVGDPWIVVDSKGSHPAKAKAFGLEGGAGELHFFVMLQGASSDDPDTLVYRGEKPVDPAGKLVVATAGKADDALFKMVKAHFDKATYDEPEEAALAKRGKLTAKNLEVFTPRMPAGAKQLVEVRVDIPDPDEPEGMGYYLAALLVIHDDGTITELSKPSAGIDAVEVDYFSDLDGDGIDEIVWKSFYYEGTYHQFTHWDGTTPVTKVLTGDGA